MPVMAISTVSAFPSVPNNTPSSSVPRLVSIFSFSITGAKVQFNLEVAKCRNTDIFFSTDGLFMRKSQKCRIFATRKDKSVFSG